jgi:hypothetical protein
MGRVSPAGPRSHVQSGPAVIGPVTRFGERSPPLGMPTWCQGSRATAQSENETQSAQVPVERQGGGLFGGPHQRTIKEPDQ